MLSRRRELLFVVVAMATGLAFAVTAFSYPADSSGFPRAIAVLLILLSVAELTRYGRSKRPMTTTADTLDDIQASQLRAAAMVFLSAPLYIALTRLFDFEVATFTYLLVGMLVLGFRKPVAAVTVSVAVLLVVKLLFFTLLDVSRAPALL